MESVRITYNSPFFFTSHVSNFRGRTAKNPPFLVSRPKKNFIQFSLAENAVSILVTSVVVGGAASLLAQRLKNSKNATEESMKSCEECNGSGICSECKGEGYVFKNISEEIARKSRMSAKNAATRYTSGLPTKWTYCSKCNSARTCRNCEGSGQVKL